MAAWPTEEAVRHLMDEYEVVESRARFMGAMAKGEITGDVLAEGDLPEPAQESSTTRRLGTYQSLYHDAAPVQPADQFPYTPRGAPIGARLLIPPQPSFQPARDAAAAVDAVHGDGNLPVLPVVHSGARTYGARYVWDRYTGEPFRLELGRVAGVPILDMVHEIGHFLDHQAFGAGNSFGSEHGDMPEVMAAIGSSDSVRAIRSLRGRRVVLYTERSGRQRQHIVDPRHVAYLLDPPELFARAYAQYIAWRSGSPGLLDELAKLRAFRLTAQVYHDAWADADFAPIAAAFDRLLLARGWIQ